MVNNDDNTKEITQDEQTEAFAGDDVFSDADIEDMESLQDLYEQSFKNIQEGEVIRGRVVQISDDFVMVDIGYKSEGHRG